MGTMLIVCMWLLFPGTTRTRYNTIYFLQTLNSIGTPWTNYWGGLRDQSVIDNLQ